MGEVIIFPGPSRTGHLRGRFTNFNKGERLAFTWKWDHESVNETNVTLTFQSLPSHGTRLTLCHEGYQDAEGRRIRDEHVEGWMFFLGKLQEIA